MTIRLDCADAFEWLRRVPSESVDLILTDPPYQSVEKHRTGALSVRRLTSWFDVIPNDVYGELLTQFCRILRGNRHCYIMCDEETIDVIKSFCTVNKHSERWFEGENGERLRYWKAIVWDKCLRGMGYHYANRHEFVMFFEKGRRALNQNSEESILSIPAIRGGGPAEKPVKLAEVLIKNSTETNMTVCDPFCGQGTFAIAALRTGRNFIGCEKKVEFVERTQQRLTSERM